MMITFQTRVNTPPELKSLPTIYGIVKNEKIQHDTQELLKRFEKQLSSGWTSPEAKREYQQYKKEHFPIACFSLSGVDRYKTTKILPEHHTGMINLDLDENTKKELDAFRRHLHELSFVHFCAKSVSGGVTGHLWANILVEIPKTFEELPENLQSSWPKEIWLDSLHKLYIFFVAHALQKRYGINIGSAKDLKRTRFLSYDAKPYSNQKATPITLQEISSFFDTIEKELPKKEHSQPEKTVSDIIRRAALDTLQQFPTKELDDRESFVEFCMACKWEGLSYDEIDGMFKKNAGYNRQENEQIYDGLNPNGSKTFGSVVRLAKKTNDVFFKERRKYYDALENTGTEEIPDGLGLASKIGLTLQKLCDMSFSTLTDKIYINDKPITDPAFSWIYCHMVDRGFKSQDMIRQVMLREANRKRFHPIKKFLNDLRWDKQERLNNDVLLKYFRDKDELFPHLMRKWLIGAVGKVFTGSQNPMIVLVGMQGKGKSHFSKFLCPLPGYYVESAIQPDNKDDLIRLTEVLVWEASELGSTTKRQDQEALKAFLSREIVIVRRPYDKYDLERPAMASFIGTVNDDGGGFLNDITGHRRFRVCHMSAIDWSYSDDIPIAQLWAEARDAYRGGETIAMGEDAQDAMSERMREHFEIKEPLEDFLREKCYFTYDDEDRIKSIDLIQAAYDAGYRGKSTRSDAMILSKVAHGLGLEKCKAGDQRAYTGIKFFTEQG